ncbi:unnamed protein product [Pylaiella littoralis]
MVAALLSGMGTSTKNRGRTGLHQAAVRGDVDEVGYLLSSGANPNTQDAHLQTPVTLAAERGLYGVVNALVEHDATDINLQDSFGRTPLHWCAKRCDVKVAEALLGTRKANVNVTTTGGDTALHWVCSAEEESGGTDQGKFEERSLRVAELLLGEGADVRAKNDRGEKPTDVLRNEAILALLVSAAQELDRQEDEEEKEKEAARAERERVTAAQAKLGEAAASSDSSSKNTNPATTATTAAEVPRQSGTGWPVTRQQEQPGAGTKAFAKSGGVLVGAGSGAAGGQKKKMVIKLKKKP